MHPLQIYLGELHDIRSTGAAVKETSYYPPLANLLNTVGQTIKPRVRCVINLKNQGAGMPDGGLFTPDQLQKGADVPLDGQPPARGAIECKSSKDDAWITADSEQVSKYWNKYRQVLVTNYRDFVLIGQDDAGKPVTLETYRLADNEKAFWKAAAHPAAIDAAQGDRFLDYLRRVMLHAAPLADPKDVAWFLASYARDARARMAVAEPALDTVRKALEEALGLTFEGERGEHFFRSTLVQTLFYGVFSAWVLWHRSHPRPGDRFDLQHTSRYLHVPVLRKLFRELADPVQLDEWKLAEVLEWTAGALNRVDRDAFFAKFKDAEAVQYFYEPFLEAFDPELRKQLGVWYTPPEIVRYMTARVDAVLREELGRPDGLADPDVYVLDPCCGTGAYLAEVLRTIAATLRDKGEDALLGSKLKAAATERVFGFEILPAPFVVAHLQVGLFLQAEGVPLDESKKERAGVYLTNALTGWEAPQEPKQRLLFAEMEEERDHAQYVKHEAPILVILGNPPYNAFAGVSPAEEQGLVEPYKAGLIAQWGIKKFNLDDLYVRFFRVAERRIAEGKEGRGVVAFISNYSWVREPSFVVLRKRLLHSFDRFWIENMHGNRKISEYAPDGKTSETIFAMRGFSPGIQQGVVLSLWVKSGKKKRGSQILFRDDLQAAKAEDRRNQLLQSLRVRRLDSRYERACPDKSNRFSFWPSHVAEQYLQWPKLVELCAVPPSNGLMEKRGGALIDINREALAERMKAYFDPEISWEEYRALNYGLTGKQARFEPKAAREKALAQEAFAFNRLVRYVVRPFDTQWCYYTGIRPVWNEPRPSLWAQCWQGNQFLLTRFRAAKSPEGVPCYYTTCLSDDHLLSPDAVAIPFRLKNGARLEKPIFQTLFDTLGDEPPLDDPVANLSTPARDYLHSLRFRDIDKDPEIARLIWYHALTIEAAPDYLAENADGVRQDWPRIPLPAERDRLLASAALGRQVAALLDTEATVAGVTSGKIRADVKVIGVPARVGGGSLNPSSELQVTARWGVAGKGGVCMPGKGKTIERAYTSDEQSALAGIALSCLGATTFDVYLNDVAFWRCVPSRVWTYTLGGYQVMKKWLSYRERNLLGRALTLDELTEVMHMARRIAALLLLQPALDANYQAVKAESYVWQLGERG